MRVEFGGVVGGPGGGGCQGALIDVQSTAMDRRAPASLVARLELSAAAAAPGETVAYAVTNAGELPIMLGEAYELERLSSGEWESVPLPYAFRLWGRRLESGERYELFARVPDLAQPGRYRLRKRLQVDGDPDPGYEWVAGQGIRPIETTAEFDVTGD